VLSRGDGDDYIGQTLARKYQVEALIGEGGMGKVYRARQVALDKLVVLKVLRQSLLGDDRTVARFKREAKAASRLNHPNSISILDFGQAEDGALFIAMEFVPGHDLHTVLSKDGPLPESRIVRIGSQVLSALYDAHAAGVIHRDLKPENIMVEQRRNEPDFVKVLDFGIAKIQDGEDGPTLTRTGFVCGTPEYMSPEQARGATLDHRSDLYAVGVLLYQLLTGRLPFESDSAVGYATKHLTEEPLPPSRKRPELRVSPAMERLIMRALSKSPDDRPQDAEVFKAELLAVEKERERRPNVAPANRRSPASAAVLAPLPRRATPPSTNLSTEITDPGWGGDSDATVRAVPERMQASAAMARMSQERTQLAAPSRPVPERDRERDRERSQPSPLVSVRAPVERMPASVPVPTITIDKAEAVVPRASEGGVGFLKAFIITLAVVSLALGAWWFFGNWRTQARNTPFVPPKNAPIPGQESGAFVPVPGVPLYEQEIPAAARNPEEAERYEQRGDDALKRVSLDLAATEYLNAFILNPSPELSLKLGEVYWTREIPAEARGWWKRHLRDLPKSKARDYLLGKVPDLLSAGNQ
jgi:serine/threonine-protein kinase